MLYDRVSLNVNYGDMDINAPEKNAELICYILGDELLSRTVWGKRPAVIVCAGGGYSSRSAREAEPIALKFCAAGFHAFVLEYSTEPTGWPAPTCELSNAVAYVRSIAEENYIDEDNIYVCGGRTPYRESRRILERPGDTETVEHGRRAEQARRANTRLPCHNRRAG